MATYAKTIGDLICGESIIYAHVASVTTPPANYTKLYFDNTGALKQINSSGTVSDVGTTTTRADLNLDTDDTVEFEYVGLGTSTVPHAGIGGCRIALDGADSSANSPSIQFTVDTDNYPLLQLMAYSTDNAHVHFDSYFDGTNSLSSNVGSNYRIFKNNDFMKFQYDSGIAQGATITWNDAIVYNTSSQIGIKKEPSDTLDINGVLRTTSTAYINDSLYTTGTFGLGWPSTSYGGEGWGKLHIRGVNSSTSIGNSLQITKTTDNYPIIQILNWRHDSVQYALDAYYDGTWRSSSSNSNFHIGKGVDLLQIKCDTGISQGSAVTWNDLFTMDSSGNIGINDSSPSYKLDVNGTVRATGDVTVDDTATIATSLGINTTTVPHAGVGIAKLALDGPTTSSSGPHVQFTTTIDDYPTMQFFVWEHNNAYINFDAYYDGSWRSSSTASNYSLSKQSDKFEILRDSGVSKGAVVSWDRGISLTTANRTGINESSPSYTLDVDGDTRVTGRMIIASSVPASAAASGVAGQITYDDSYIYIGAGTNTWLRLATTTW